MPSLIHTLFILEAVIRSERKTYLNSNIIKQISDFSSVQVHHDYSATLFKKFVYCYTIDIYMESVLHQNFTLRKLSYILTCRISYKMRNYKLNTQITLKIILIFCFIHNCYNLQPLIVGENISYNLLSFISIFEPYNILFPQKNNNYDF